MLPRRLPLDTVGVAEPEAQFSMAVKWPTLTAELVARGLAACNLLRRLGVAHAKLELVSIGAAQYDASRRLEFQAASTTTEAPFSVARFTNS